MNSYQKILVLLFFIEIKFILPQIFDNYESNILEEGNYDILDVTDYHNINLIVSTSKNIYTSIPPSLKVTTNANLINSSSLITINENYLLVACLQDSFLGKIRLSDGTFTSLLSYTNIGTYSSLDIPIKICSLSNIDNTIFIGYSKIEYFEETDETNKTNIIFKLNINNKDDVTNGPLINDLVEIKSFQFPKSTVMTSSSRQISCEPIKIKGDINNEYRLVCLHEGIYEYSSEGNTIWENKVYATTIKSDFSDFEVNMTESQMKYGDKDLGLRIYKENDTYARCMTSNALVEIHLITTDSITKINKSNLPTILYSFNADIDLISYNNKFRFTAKKTTFMKKENIYCFQINLNYYTNYFKLYNYKENNIKKIFGYFNQDSNKILLLFQTNNNIKYFTFNYIRAIFIFDSSSTHTNHYLASFEKAEYPLNYLSTYGYLNVESIKIGIRQWYETEMKYFGIDFFESFVTNNKFIPTPSLHDWKVYYFSLMENIENQYTRIYHIDNLNTVIETCSDTCTSCFERYNTCTDCSQQKFAKLIDDASKCFPPSYKVKQYIYDSESNKFLKCYDSCEYCSESINSSSDNKHNCARCLPGYLNSYVNPGNCYEYPSLGISDEKRIDNGIFISADCPNYKIASTGECVDRCPISTPYYTYEYNMTSEKYEKIDYNPPKFLINKICYEEETPEFNADEDSYIVSNRPEPIPPLPPIEEQSNCSTIYENRCYPECPQGTCLTQEDPSLKTCVEIKPGTQVFNNICFENFESLTKNIKTMSENNEVIEAGSGIIIRGYSTNDDEESVDENAKYSLVNLGDCENKLKSFYNLSNDTELFILGIDSPNKDITASTNTYNYGVYLEDGTLLDHVNVCKESKISISSPIINPELVKLAEASYFSESGYDIFDENSTFYSDNCAPASIDGNDIILSDRKKDFYPSNISLCNDSCYYSQVNFKSKRFTCECDLFYNFSEKNIKIEETVEEEDVGYIEYLLSLINYKIFICYELFYDYKSYYYNAGFYIALGTLFFCSLQIIIFLKCGLRKMNINIFENIPNKTKLEELYKEQMRKRNEFNLQPESNAFDFKENPPKKDSKEEFNLNIDNQEMQIIENNKIQKNKNVLRKPPQTIENKMNYNRKDKFKSKTINYIKIQKIKEYNLEVETSKNNLPTKNKKIIFKKNKGLTIYDNSLNVKLNEHKENDIYNYNKYDEKVEIKDFNLLPYSQALRIDNRNYGQIFLSVVFSEIKIIRIFYYKSPYEHLSILFSKYIFELCLDLTFNCILYTEDVISEKYNNNGSIKFFTTLSLSFISNIISSIIAFLISKLADYIDIFEFVIKDVTNKAKYFLNIIKFKQILCIKLTIFFIIQAIFNIMMCYYLMIFCTVYHKTQVSIMINYITGIAESLAISLGLALITSLMRYLSIKYKWRSIYYTSKYFFENF